MEPGMPRLPLAQQPWFVELLDGKGFSRSSPDTFSNGKATIHVEGTNFCADPGTDDKIWTADFEDADRSTIKMMVEQILKMRPFQTDVDLAKERIEKQAVERALTGLANTIKEGPDTDSGVQLRRFLWSLYNSHHLINLCRMTYVLDAQRSAWVSEVFAGAFVGLLKEDDIKRALLVAGDMRRRDEVKPSDEQRERIEEAERHIDGVLRSLPPSNAHIHLKDARERLGEAKNALRRARETPTREEDSGVTHTK